MLLSQKLGNSKRILKIIINCKAVKIYKNKNLKTTKKLKKKAVQNMFNPAFALGKF